MLGCKVLVVGFMMCKSLRATIIRERTGYFFDFLAPHLSDKIVAPKASFYKQVHFFSFWTTEGSELPRDWSVLILTLILNSTDPSVILESRLPGRKPRGNWSIWTTGVMVSIPSLVRLASPMCLKAVKFSAPRSSTSKFDVNWAMASWTYYLPAQPSVYTAIWALGSLKVHRW